MQEQLALLPLWYLAFLFSLTCHEAAHALAAKWGGDLTAYYGGQVSLNPLPHIQREIFGTVVVPLLTFVMGGWMMGWGSAPFDPYWQQRYPRRAAWMALAGPIANFTIVIAAAILIHVGIFAGFFAVPDSVGFDHLVGPGKSPVSEGFAQLLSILFSLNLLLGTFNLIPVPPLDGHSAIGLLLPESVALKIIEFGRNPMFSMMGLLVAWRLFDGVFPVIFGFGVGALYWNSRFF